MTTAALSPSVQYNENGVSLAFAAPFRFLASSHLEVKRILNGSVSVLALGTHYAVTGGTTDAGGTVTLLASVNGAKLKITRKTPRSQSTDYDTNDTFPAETHELALDRAMLIDQEQDASILDLQTRALLVPEGEVAPPLGSMADLAEGDVMVFRAGKIQRHDRALFVGKFFAGGASGELVPSSGFGADAALRTDLASPSAGAALVAFKQAGTGPASQTVADKLLHSSVHLMDFIPKAQWAAIEAGVSTYDATGAMLEALNRKKRIIVPGGTTLLNVTNLPSGAEIEGECRNASVLSPYNHAWFVLFADSGSASVASNIKDIRIANMTVRAFVGTDGFFEHIHLISLNGVDNALIEKLTGEGFRGDGIYLGSGLNNGGSGFDVTERHNRNVTIRDFVLDGINRNNRNGISVIDCDGLTIEKGTIRNTSRNGAVGYTTGTYDVMNPLAGPGMPGPIDLEPDAQTFHLIRDVTIDTVGFFDNGGMLGQVGLYIPSVVTSVPTGIDVKNCRSWNYQGRGYDFLAKMARAVTTDSRPQAINVDNWFGAAGCAPIFLDEVRGVSIKGVWWDYTTHALIGYEPSRNVVDLDLEVQFNTVGSSTGVGLFLGNLDGANLCNSMFNKCGTDSSTSYQVLFAGGRASQRVNVDGVQVVGRTSQTYGIAAPGHTWSTSTSRLGWTRLTSGLANDLNLYAVGVVLTGSATLNPPSMPNATYATVGTISVPGTMPGDFVQVSTDTTYAINYFGAAGADTVTVFAYNLTGSTIDPPAAVFNARVIKK